MKPILETYRLVDLCAAIGEAIEANFESPIWIEADITSLSARANGHCYLDLSDTDEENNEAKLRGTIWRNRWSTIAHYFKAQSGQELQKGLRVRLLAQVGYHITWGLSVNIIDVDPEFTLGAHRQKREQILAKLMLDGLLDRQKDLTLGALLLRIAVVSSETAAGFQDFVEHLNGSSFDYRVSLFPAVMQGAEVETSIITQLTILADRIEEFDCIVIIRGGGADADLFGFDSYKLGKAIAEIGLPILTGIGHEKDHTIPDFVAHARHKTPTAVAAYLLEHNIIAENAISELQERLGLAVSQCITESDEKLRDQIHHLQMAARLRVEVYKGKCSRHTLLVDSVQKNALQTYKNYLERFEGRINAVDPRRILEMGYAILKNDNRIIFSVNQFKGVTDLDIILRDGEKHIRIGSE